MNMLVSSAAVAAATPVARADASRADEIARTPFDLAMPFDEAALSPELKAAVSKLAEASDSLVDAKARLDETYAAMKEWEECNPRPKNVGWYSRKMLKWGKRHERAAIETGYGGPVIDEWRAALDAFQECQLALAIIKPKNPTDFIAKASAVATFEEGQKSIKHIVARSLAYDVVSAHMSIR